MAITEEQASRCWCPFAQSRVVIWNRTATEQRNYVYAADDGPDDPLTNCIGANCMAWRWLPLMADDAYLEAVKKAAVEIGDKSSSRAQAAKHVNANRAKYGLPTQPFEGYCGLAGKP